MTPRIEPLKARVLRLTLPSLGAATVILLLWTLTRQDGRLVPPLTAALILVIGCVLAWRWRWSHATSPAGRNGDTVTSPAGRNGDTVTSLDAGHQKLLLATAGIVPWERRFDVADVRRSPASAVLVRDVVENLAFQAIPEDRPAVERAFAAALGGAELFDVTFRHRTEADHVAWRREIGRVFRGRADRPVCVSGLSMDVTAASEAEAQLRTAKREADSANLAKSEFLAYISHEIRTPLAAILGFCEILDDPDQAPENCHEMVRIIRRNSELLATLVSNVLDLSKIEAGRLEVERLSVDVRDVVSDVCLSLEQKAKAKGVQLASEFHEPLPTETRTDPTRLKQILMNIVGNAVKFTDRGTVRLAVRGVPPATALAPWQLEFLIEDTGIGVTEEQRSCLFQSFVQAESGTTRKYGGSGLGLALSRKLARTLGGDVELVSSKIGCGTTFRVRVAAS